MRRDRDDSPRVPIMSEVTIPSIVMPFTMSHAHGGERRTCSESITVMSDRGSEKESKDKAGRKPDKTGVV
jgi:hypothetical protein